MTASPEILLVSKDDPVLTYTRRKVLEAAGFRTYWASSLGLAASMAVRRKMTIVILESSFSLLEQSAFVESLHESYPEIHVLCFGYEVLGPEELLSECRSILSGQPGSARVHRFELPRAS